MNNTNNKQDHRHLNIDFSMLMDLRVDFAFKQLFGEGDIKFLISLLNAIFANKKFSRIIKSLTIVSPILERYSEEDKSSILDIRAQMDDGSMALIEMHVYGLEDLKYKTIRSWARVYGAKLKKGEKYLTQPPVICVAFVDGSLDVEGYQKIHKCCQIMDIDDHTVFSDSLELHYIDMTAFVNAVNEQGGIGKGEVEEIMLAKWLSVITEKDIKDKTIVANICKEQEEIGMAVSALAVLSEDKVTRQAYEKRQEEIMLYHNKIKGFIRTIEQERLKAEQERRKAEQAKLGEEQEKRRAEQAERALEKKDAELAKQTAEIEKLNKLLAESNFDDQLKLV